MQQNNQELYHQGLFNISPTDGREALFTAPLRGITSEAALYKYRCEVELRLLLHMIGALGKKPLSESETALINKMIEEKAFDVYAIADLDHFGWRGLGPLEHDVKSVEIYLREELRGKIPDEYLELLHFPATSEDVNNISWNLMLRDSVNKAWLPNLLYTSEWLAGLILSSSNAPVMGRTHGMPATPTTVGKRFAYFLDKIVSTLHHMQALDLSAKFSGPVGNHNAMTAVMPSFNMEATAKSFVESFGFPYKTLEHQRNSHIEIVRVLNEINLINLILIDLCEHIRIGIMTGHYDQLTTPGDTRVGSSVMPQKTNPWAWEVGQGYLEQSVAIIDSASKGLVLSLNERDLTDHPWERSYGEMIGKSLIGINYINIGFKTIMPNTEFALEELEKHPEVMTEAIQIAGRLCGTESAYMAVKEASRGKKLNMEQVREIIKENIPDTEMQKRLLALTPEEYTGNAAVQAQVVANYYLFNSKPSLQKGMFFPFSGIRAVLFDFDGTLQLNDKEELFARLKSVNEALGSGFTDDEVRGFGNRSDFREMRQMMINEHNRRFGENQIDETLFMEKNNAVSGTFDHLLEFAPGVKELLGYLHEHEYLMGIVTTRGSKSFYRIIETHGIDVYFSVCITRDDTTERKPSPEPLLRAIEKMRIDPKECLFIGDKIGEDVPPAAMLGMKSILISEKERGPYDPIPTYQVRSFDEIKKLFTY